MYIRTYEIKQKTSFSCMNEHGRILDGEEVSFSSGETLEVHFRKSPRQRIVIVGGIEKRLRRKEVADLQRTGKIKYLSTVFTPHPFPLRTDYAAD